MIVLFFILRFSSLHVVIPWWGWLLAIGLDMERVENGRNLRKLVRK